MKEILARNQTRRGRSLRLIRNGMFFGVGAALVVILCAERRMEATERGSVRASRLPANSGPAPLSMRTTIGGPWLGLAGTIQLPLKADLAQADPLLGAGYSSGRGGTGTSWGPLGEVQNAPLTKGAWAGFNAPLAPRTNPSPHPIYPLEPQQLVVGDAGDGVNMAVASRLRRRDQGD